MTVGISVPLPAYTFDPAIITKKAEHLGFDSIWYAEHPACPSRKRQHLPGDRRRDSLDLFAFQRPQVSRWPGRQRSSHPPSNWRPASHWLKRNPLLLAKEISVLDLHSGGRFIFGFGTGWLKEETELVGGNLHAAGHTGARSPRRHEAVLDTRRDGISRGIF